MNEHLQYTINVKINTNDADGFASRTCVFCFGHGWLAGISDKDILHLHLHFWLLF
jgi:hypothetical protein